MRLRTLRSNQLGQYIALHPRRQLLRLLLCQYLFTPIALLQSAACSAMLRTASITQGAGRIQLHPVCTNIRPVVGGIRTEAAIRSTSLNRRVANPLKLWNGLGRQSTCSLQGISPASPFAALSSTSSGHGPQQRTAVLKPGAPPSFASISDRGGYS